MHQGYQPHVVHHTPTSDILFCFMDRHGTNPCTKGSLNDLRKHSGVGDPFLWVVPNEVLEVQTYRHGNVLHLRPQS